MLYLPGNLMKLALIRRRFTSTGGAELYVQRLLGGLVQRGHEVHLLTEEWDQAPLGVNVSLLPIKASRAARPLAFADRLQAFLEERSYDCVFSLERTLRQDVYRAGDGVHRAWLDRRRAFAPWWRRPFLGRGVFHRNMVRLEAATFNPANTRRVIVNSEMVRREIRERFDFPAERIHLVRNGVETKRFQSGNRTGTRERLGVREDDFLLLFVGSGWERKGLKYLIEAMRQLAGQRIRLLVVGKGSPPGQPPSNVIFAGSLAAVEDAYAAADLFVFLPIYEPSANVCFEALAAGLPVVTSSQNGAGEILVENLTGSVVQRPDDVGAVLKAIRFWASRPKGRISATLDLALDRNVDETLAVLELAAREK